MRPNVTGIVLALALGIPACSSRAGDTLTASTREEALSPATTPPSSSLVAALTALRYLNDVDVYVTGDIVAACSDTQGRMAAGGSITLQRYEADSLGLADLAWGGPAAAATSVDCGGTFDLVNGSIAGGARGVECGTVDASHYDLGNVRATCAGAHEPKGTRSDGSVNGVETCGPLFFPEATFAAQMDAASTAISELFAGVTPAKPKVQAATGGGTELVFAPTSTAAQSFYIVSAADLLEHWVLTPGSVYFITTDVRAGVRRGGGGRVRDPVPAGRDDAPHRAQRRDAGPSRADHTGPQRSRRCVLGRPGRRALRRESLREPGPPAGDGERRVRPRGVGTRRASRDDEHERRAADQPCTVHERLPRLDVRRQPAALTGPAPLPDFARRGCVLASRP
jgi:choice-of-anchor A domain-containing protein